MHFVTIVTKKKIHNGILIHVKGSINFAIKCIFIGQRLLANKEIWLGQTSTIQ